jgi:rhodanese-related sulfurtransferase
MNIGTAAKLISAVNVSAQFQWIDVRSPGEFSAGHIPGAVNIPMEQIESRLDDLLPGVPIVLICQAGKRARMVAALLEPCRKDVTVLEGGTVAWNAAGLPLLTCARSRFSLERQVRLIAGILVLTSVLLSLARSQSWIYLAAAVGTGLIFAGLTDNCLMAGLLIRLPQNQARTGPTVNRQACSL